MLAVGIDVFDCADIVVDCLVGSTCSVADGAVDASPGHSELLLVLQ